MNKSEAWKWYADIHRSLLGYPATERLLHIKLFDSPIYYTDFVIVLLELFQSDQQELHEYIKFVHSQWSACKTTSDALFPNWLSSPKMVKRFKAGERARTKAMTITDTPRTYSSHINVGASEDTEFDIGTICES